MFVDASAIVAILTREPEADALSDAGSAILYRCLARSSWSIRPRAVDTVPRAVDTVSQ
jgi:uncharacterized protein with PIN domain